MTPRQYFSEKEEDYVKGTFSDRELIEGARLNKGTKLREKVFTPEFSSQNQRKQSKKLTT